MSIIAKVITINLDNNKVHDERTVRLNTISGQRWLIAHMNWAMSNGHGLQMLNQEDAEPSSLPGAAGIALSA